MSFVTTPISSSSRRARQSAATRELLPDPTGPPMPIRSGRSGGKEPPLRGRVSQRGELERGSEAGRERTRLVLGGRRSLRKLVDQGRRVEQPARGGGRVDRQQPDRSSGRRGRILVEVRARDLHVGQA